MSEQYQIVRAWKDNGELDTEPAFCRLSIRVNELMADGWNPSGGIAVIPETKTKLFSIQQAMIRLPLATTAEPPKPDLNPVRDPWPRDIWISSAKEYIYRNPPVPVAWDKFYHYRRVDATVKPEPLPTPEELQAALAKIEKVEPPPVKCVGCGGHCYSGVGPDGYCGDHCRAINPGMEKPEPCARCKGTKKAPYQGQAFPCVDCCPGEWAYC
jgi:hypothetical protein